MHNSVQPEVYVISEPPIGGDFWLFVLRESELEVIPFIFGCGYPASFPTKGQITEPNA